LTYTLWMVWCLTLFYHYVFFQAVVMLPTMFGHEFGDQVYRYATLVDQNHNEFEVLVEERNGKIYLTKGWDVLRDFYNISLGAWVTVVFVGLGKFSMNIKIGLASLFVILCLCPWWNGRLTSFLSTFLVCFQHLLFMMTWTFNSLTKRHLLHMRLSMGIWLVH